MIKSDCGVTAQIKISACGITAEKNISLKKKSQKKLSMLILWIYYENNERTITNSDFKAFFNKLDKFVTHVNFFNQLPHVSSKFDFVSLRKKQNPPPWQHRITNKIPWCEVLTKKFYYRKKTESFLLKSQYKNCNVKLCVLQNEYSKWSKNELTKKRIN